jgi:homoserine kinase
LRKKSGYNRKSIHKLKPSLEMSMKKITAFAPASVANVGCGFDIMGFAIGGIGDRVTIETATGKEDSKITVTGPYGSLIPAERERNTAGVAVDAWLNATGKRDLNLRISLEKNLPLGSGLGSSAASSAAAVFAVNEMFGRPLGLKELIPFAMEGERAACGSAHADNVAPSLLGGFILIRSYDPLDIVQIKCPDELFCAVVHPHIELKTADARRVLKRDIPMQDVIRQSANAAAFMVGLLHEDYDLIGRSVTDLVAEPQRTQLIPGFQRVKSAALDAGATGCGISGSGPSVFALCRGESLAAEMTVVMQKAFLQAGLISDAFVSSVNSPGTFIESL